MWRPVIGTPNMRSTSSYPAATLAGGGAALGTSSRGAMAGDTGYGRFFTMVHDRFQSFRLALLPIAPARPRGAMAPRHMSAGDAVRAAELLQVETSIAIHFGTFQQGDDGQEEPDS